jgi:hypothetical protein
MKKFQEYAGYGIVAVAAFLTGLIVAFNIISDQACYFNAEWDNIHINLGECKIADYDLSKITERDAGSFAVNIQALPYDNYLSTELRDIRDSYKGPFQLKVVEIYVRFTDDKSVKYPNAAGYRGYLLNQELSIFELVEPEELRKFFTHKSFQVMLENPKPPDLPLESSQNTIWIEKKHACEWLNIGDVEHLPDRLKVHASVIRKVGAQPLKIPLVSYFSDDALN